MQNITRNLGEVSRVVVEPSNGTSRVRVYRGNSLLYEERFRTKMVAESFGKAIAKDRKAKFWVGYDYSKSVR